MNYFDAAILYFFNQGARKSWIFDQVVAFLSVNNLLKGGILVALVWWAWFRNDDRRSNDREHIIATLLSSIVALALARVLVLTLPFRLRPLYEEGLGLVRPYGVAEGALDGLSSFPSDHAVLFFTLATGLFFVSRRVGLFACFYVAVCIALPRIYLGLHYPTDILAGAMLGMTINWIANRYLPQTKLVQSVANFSYSRPGFFYPLFFLLTYQIADLFESSREVVGGVFKLLKYMVS
ncbi:MAG: phosphatase PAP2 family protein [Polaromonas sp.]